MGVGEEGRMGDRETHGTNRTKQAKSWQQYSDKDVTQTKLQCFVKSIHDYRSGKSLRQRAEKSLYKGSGRLLLQEKLTRIIERSRWMYTC